MLIRFHKGALFIGISPIGEMYEKRVQIDSGVRQE